MDKLFEEKLRTIIKETIEEAFANKQRLDEMARVGFLGNEYDVLVHTDDRGFIPHVHVIDRNTNGRDFDCCIQLETNRYFTHGRHVDELNSKGCKMFNDFMNQPCRSPKYSNNYEFAVEMWNTNNSSSYVQVKEDEDGNVIVPDYRTIGPYK